MIDLQAALADYAYEHELELRYTMRPSVENVASLPSSDEEASVRRTKDTGNYYIYDDGSWNLVLENSSIDTESFEYATHEEVLEALRAGEVDG